MQILHHKHPSPSLGRRDLYRYGLALRNGGEGSGGRILTASREAHQPTTHSPRSDIDIDGKVHSQHRFDFVYR